MRGSFFGLNIATRGLFTSQRALDITNHNINNVNTPGYSRQVAEQRAAKPIGVFDGTGMIGNGSEVIGISRIRDDFLDFKYWSENVSYGEWTTKRTALEELESIFAETEESGTTKMLNEFFDSMQELAKNPGSAQTREVVKSTGEALAKDLNATAAQLQKARDDNNHIFKIKVDEINSYANQIRALSEQIHKAEIDGSKANDLRDRRELILDNLSKVINIDVSEVVVGELPNGKDNKQLQVSINGLFLVNHIHSHELECYEDEDDDKMYQVRWKQSGNSIEPRSGELKGYMDVRDGKGTDGEYKGIPYYMHKLNEFARNFARSFNEGIFRDGEKYYPGHAGGVGRDGSENIKFFSYDYNASEDLDNHDNITAANITISSDILHDINKIAAASVAGEPENNDNILNLLALRHDRRTFAEGAPEDFMRSLVANLGIDAQQTVRMSESQKSIVAQIENKRLSVSGVSIDEEMANMVKYQHAYNAAAKMISVVNEIYDVTINRMGV